ncbi:MAG: hypothetical protein KGJ78_16320 [Alphaproteobacteria bacterium]|nr:hypothetical protein [Alphaproteobacteria bacterium]
MRRRTVLAGLGSLLALAGATRAQNASALYACQGVSPSTDGAHGDAVFLIDKGGSWAPHRLQYKSNGVAVARGSLPEGKALLGDDRAALAFLYTVEVDPKTNALQTALESVRAFCPLLADPSAGEQVFSADVVEYSEPMAVKLTIGAYSGVAPVEAIELSGFGMGPVFVDFVVPQTERAVSHFCGHALSASEAQMLGQAVQTAASGRIEVGDGKATYYSATIALDAPDKRNAMVQAAIGEAERKLQSFAGQCIPNMSAQSAWMLN